MYSWGGCNSMKIRESLDELLNANEGEQYQFKEWKTKNDFRMAAKICCALANCGGGKLVLGITDKRPRRIVGSTAFPQPERTRIDLMNKLHIGIDFHIYMHENKRVLVFDVASRPIGLPVQADDGAWWYQGDSLILMPEDVRLSIFAESGHDFSGDICTGLTIQDLDPDAIKIFRKTWHEYSGNNRIMNLSTRQLLSDCGAFTDDGLTYAALILFGKRKALQKYLPHAEVIFEYRMNESAGPAAQRVELQDGFFNNYHRIWELVNLRNNKQHYQDKFHLFPINTFNEQVVRESVLNAVSHRDYRLPGCVFVRQYQYRIEIENPGGFPSGITVENILNKQAARNHKIASIFKLCGLVERAGQGMNLIFEQTIKEAKPLPDFSKSDAWHVKLILNGEIHHPKMLSLFKKLDEDKIKSMTTDDYILLASLYCGKGLDKINISRFDHLMELGIVKQDKYGISPINGEIILPVKEDNTQKSKSLDIISAINAQSTESMKTADWQLIEATQSTESVDWKLIGKDDRKQMIIDFIASNTKTTSSQIAKLTRLSQTRVRELLQELIADGVIEKIGNYRHTAYRVKYE